jgi:hypothetical protein
MKKIMVLVAIFAGASLVEASCCQDTCKATKKAVKHLDSAADAAKKGCDKEGCSTCKKVEKDLRKCSDEAGKACGCLTDCCKKNGHNVNEKRKSKKK